MILEIKRKRQEFLTSVITGVIIGMVSLQIGAHLYSISIHLYSTDRIIDAIKDTRDLISL